jgi:hypothetical protein
MTDLESSDLICRSRREPLSGSEEQQLLRELDRSEEAQWHADTLDQSERDSAVQPGDDALVARMATQALKQAKTSGRLRVRAHALQIAAAVLLVGAMAGALGWSGVIDVPGFRSTSIQEPDPAPTKPPLRPEKKRRRKSQDDGVPPAPDESNVPSPDESPRAVAAEFSAEELLSKANLARREGRTAEARRAYQALVRAHPKSREAPLAHLALGKMLEESEPALAVFHYRALVTRDTGLRAEGLWGLAECSRKLGRDQAEQEALRKLVAEFPASPYAAAARGRVRDESP